MYIGWLNFQLAQLRQHTCNTSRAPFHAHCLLIPYPNSTTPPFLSHPYVSSYTHLFFVFSPTLLSPPLVSKATKVYSEATDQSSIYLRYHINATAYFFMQWHTFILKDFQRVLTLTANIFCDTHLTQARIHTREGAHALACASLALY
ncbi:hypothetical protein BJ165DRAFT_332239 [Panaeolus papilionaceus]|nr:hypothetical protein BJ165DRAFT_332239 [Panaeolus papilionaceus]